MAKTAWIFSYKIKKNVTDEEFIEKQRAYMMKLFLKQKGLFLGNIMCKKILGLILYYGKVKKMRIMLQR